MLSPQTNWYVVNAFPEKYIEMSLVHEDNNRSRLLLFSPKIGLNVLGHPF